MQLNWQKLEAAVSSEPWIEVVYTWPDGRKEVRYTRTVGTPDAQRLIEEVAALRARQGDQCPYSIRERVPTTSAARGGRG